MFLYWMCHLEIILVHKTDLDIRYGDTVGDVEV